MPARRKSPRRSKSRSKSPRRVLKRRSSGKARTSRRVTRRRSPKRTYKGTDIRYGAISTAASLPAPSIGLIDNQIVQISNYDIEGFDLVPQDAELLISEVTRLMNDVRLRPHMYSQDIRSLVSDQARTKQRIIELQEELTRQRDSYITQVQMYKWYMLKLVTSQVRNHSQNYSQTIRNLVESLELTSEEPDKEPGNGKNARDKFIERGRERLKPLLAPERDLGDF